MTDLPNPPLPPEYPEWLERLKAEIRHAQGRAALAVNTEMIRLYWCLGREILAKQATQGWGKRVIDNLADDLQREFPQMKGLSPRNLRYMRQFCIGLRGSSNLATSCCQIALGP